MVSIFDLTVEKLDKIITTLYSHLDYDCWIVRNDNRIDIWLFATVNTMDIYQLDYNIVVSDLGALINLEKDWYHSCDRLDSKLWTAIVRQ